MSKIKVGIIGGTGYTGIELYRWLQKHPQAEVVYVTSESYSGKPLSTIYPEVAQRCDIQLKAFEEIKNQEVDAAFFCLPHGHAVNVVPEFVSRGVKVIDISADFRLNDTQSYKRWYGFEHPYPELLQQAVYGLPELNREKISQATLVANPGCYPTSVILALAPLLQKQVIKNTEIIIDSKSGLSGAGKKLSLTTHFVEATENVAAYNIGRLHRHVVEMEQELTKLAQSDCKIVFSPHLVPMERGILSTIYVRLGTKMDKNALNEVFTEYYAGKKFVRICTTDLPKTRWVSNSNYCDIAICPVPETMWTVVVSAIDNLVKGASGQAIQNMNIMFGLPEEMGLI